jgi:hypothetical protein
MTVDQETLGCSVLSAARLAPHDPKIAGNFEIPIHIGKLIAAWDRPKFVDAAQATHMRDDDYVVGVEYQGHCRAYPLWITDNYHMINDKIAGDPILFSTCERCQSGSAFMSKVAGEAVKFSAMGMYNASLTMTNRRRSKTDQPSLWLHYEGVAIDGPRKGDFLEQIPAFHMTWQAWAAAHPKTDVMLAPNDPHHRDARHGHGREEYFSRPGMDPPLAKTITGKFDHRYPENEMVLGLNIDAGIRAYPLLEIKREGSVLNDELGQLPIVVLCGPEPEQVTMSAFSRRLGDRVLNFECCDHQICDRETGSLWTIEGQAVAGSLQGQRLTPLRWQYVRWHAWVYPHPSTELFMSARALARYPNFPACAQVRALHDVLTELSALNADLTFSHVILELALPHEATHGICVYYGSDRLNLYAFASPAAAKDHVELQGAWFCLPFDAKIARKRALCLGAFVLESDPIDQYAEPTQTVHYPDNETAWSQLVLRDEEAPAWASALEATEPPEGHFMSLISYLRQKRYDVVECAFLPHSQLRVGTISAIAATIEADRFAIYRCVDEASAATVAAEVTHAIQVGPWVLRSIPVLMYADPHYEMGQLPDKEIAWSSLLNNESFRTALQDFVS